MTQRVPQVSPPLRDLGIHDPNSTGSIIGEKRQRKKLADN